MKKTALALITFTFLASVSLAESKNFDGWVTDAKCAASKGASASHAACAKKCAEAGIALVFVSDKDQAVLKIDNPDVVKGHEGHHVSVSGAVSGDSIHVEKVVMLEQPKATDQQKGEHGPGM